MVVSLLSLQDSAQRNNYFQRPAESGGEDISTAFPILPKSRLRVERDKREQTFPSDGCISLVISCSCVSSYLRDLGDTFVLPKLDPRTRPCPERCPSWVLKVGYLGLGAKGRGLTKSRTSWPLEIHSKAMSYQKVQWTDPCGRCLWLATPRHSRVFR